MQPIYTQANKALYTELLEQGLESWVAHLPSQLEKVLNKEHNSHIPAWQSAVTRLPVLTNDIMPAMNADAVGILGALTTSEHSQIKNLLKKLMPWRKGPYQLGHVTPSTLAPQDSQGIVIDTEWHSDFKWQRLLPHLSPLKHRKVLDVGGGNGYHAWRMAGEHASFVLVIDPSTLFYYQFMAIKHFITQAISNKSDMPQTKQPNVHFIPTGIESVPQNLNHFDTVFSMGVLYHRPSPFEHLQQLKGCLRKGGELVLETLVIEGDETSVFVPEGRYASMNNVYFLPSSQALCLWLKKAGFQNVRVVDEQNTSLDEQRQTDWMTFHSLAQFLQPDLSKTIEGHPVPRRAIILANA